MQLLRLEEKLREKESGYQQTIARLSSQVEALEVLQNRGTEVPLRKEEETKEGGSALSLSLSLKRPHPLTSRLLLLSFSFSPPSSLSSSFRAESPKFSRFTSDVRRHAASWHRWTSQCVDLSEQGEVSVHTDNNRGMQ